MSLPPEAVYVRGWLEHELPGVDAMGTLLAELAWEQPRCYGREWPTPYGYSGLRHDDAPWHPLVRQIRDLITSVTGLEFNSCVANLYRDGRDSIAWHADDEPELGEDPAVASVSLGAARRFACRPRSARSGSAAWFEEHVGGGDLVLMPRGFQRLYAHAVPRTSRLVGPRINLTFREVVA